MNKNIKNENVEKIKYLNSYTICNSKIEFIDNKDEIRSANIPDYWKKAFLEEDFEQQKEVILLEWKKFVESELSNTISYLNQFLTNVELMKIGTQYSILYTVSSYQTKQDLFYEGKNPIDSIHALEESLKKKWNTVDKSVTNFYQNIHNGFYDFTSKSMGLDSTDTIESMGDYEWEHEDQLTFDTTYLYNFFSNGMGDYIVLDINKSVENGAFLWSKSELPKLNLNFWDMIDEWIIVGLDN